MWAEFSPSSTNTDQYGIYIQDQITLFDNLKLLLGGRFDWVEQRTKEEGELTGSQSDDAFSPRVGIVLSTDSTDFTLRKLQPLIQTSYRFSVR